jgi:hypothetical protein
MKKTILLKQLCMIPMLLLFASNANSQSLSQSFDATTFPPTGWTNTHTAGTETADVWERAAANTLGGGVGGDTYLVDPYSGAGMAIFRSYDFADGTAALLASPAVNLAGKPAQLVSFWMYRDDGSDKPDSLSVYINTAKSLTGAAFLGQVQRYILNDPAESEAAGWYKYSFIIPLNYNTATNYILFHAVSHYGNNIFVDDITVEDNPVATCSGTPVAGNIGGASGVCAGTPFTLTNPGATDVPGVHYAWQSATAADGPWTNIPGQTGFDEATGLTQTSTTWYRLVDTCSTSSLSAMSNVLTVTMNAAEQCYCKPPGVTLHSLADDYITNITIAGTTLNASTGTNISTGYTQVAPTPANNTADLFPATSYTVTATVANDAQAGVWVDVDRNGTLDADEFVNLAVLGNTATGTITIPANALPGLTGLRIRARSFAVSNADACATFASGETEDYVVNIVAPVYTFTGTGNWSLASNWSNNKLPPVNLPSGSTIVIDHSAGGQCVLDKPQTIAAGSTLTVLTGKNLIIAGGLSIH